MATHAAPARILVAEDISTIALVIHRLLRERGHSVRLVANGALALDALRREPFDLVVTDWVMPEVDGAELIGRLRAESKTPPPVVMQTAVDTSDAREAVMEVGADEYLAKPWDHTELVAVVERCLARSRAPRARPRRSEPAAPLPSATPKAVPFACVCIAASTGGPVAVRALLDELDPADPATYVVVVHGPVWMLESFAQQLGRSCPLPVLLAASVMQLERGHVYISPGAHHTVVEPQGMCLQVVDMPPENFVRPAADPLFRTAAIAFGSDTLAVVMTGLGRDGTQGASRVVAAGGRVLVQRPDTCVASSMPQSILDAGIPARVVPESQLASAIHSLANAFARARRA